MELTLKTPFLFATIFNGIFFTLLGSNFNLERLLFFGLLIPLLIFVFHENFLTKTANSGPYLGGWLIGLWCSSLLLSLMLSKDPKAHINAYVISIAPAILYFLFASGTKTSTLIRLFLEYILWYLSAFGVAVYFLGLFNSPFKYFIDENLLDTARIKLTLIEANIFGATISYFLILHFPYFKFSIKHCILYPLALLALILSYSRGPYIAFLAGTFVYLFATNFFKKTSTLFLIAMLFLTGSVFCLAFSDKITAFYSENLDRQGTLEVRDITLGVAQERFIERPIFGNGPLDLGISAPWVAEHIYSQTPQEVNIWQMFIAIAHDSGVVGLVIYCIFLVGLLWHGFRLAFMSGSRKHASYLAGFVALLVASQTTTLHLTALYGIAAGILGSAANDGSLWQIKKIAPLRLQRKQTLKHDQKTPQLVD